MLSSNGSVRSSFILLFLAVVVICIIYFVGMSKGNLLTRVFGSSSDNNNYEKELSDATANYINYYYNDLKSGDRLIIKLTTLREYGYAKMTDCSGYSIVEVKGENVITPYVKCSNYKSRNYAVDYE